MPKLPSACAIVKCLSERSLGNGSNRASTWVVEASTHDSTGDEPCDILFEATPASPRFVRVP